MTLAEVFKNHRGRKFKRSAWGKYTDWTEDCRIDLECAIADDWEFQPIQPTNFIQAVAKLKDGSAKEIRRQAWDSDGGLGLGDRNVLLYSGRAKQWNWQKLEDLLATDWIAE